MHSHLKIHSRNLGKPIRKLGILWQRMTGNIFYWENKERQVIKELLKGFISNVLIKIFPVLRSGFWLISWTYSYMEIRQILQVSQHKYLMTSDCIYSVSINFIRHNHHLVINPILITFLDGPGSLFRHLYYMYVMVFILYFHMVDFHCTVT